MGKKRVAISTMHLYGQGGGARAVAWFARALQSLGWSVDIFTSTTIPAQVEAWLPRGLAYAGAHPLCGQGYDLLLNIDHFNYSPPLAKKNWAHIFQPHERNRPVGGYDLWANSQYTVAQIKEQWDLPAKYIYIPVSDQFRPMRKQKWITHCSRFVKPTSYADKGHRQMIMAFIQGCEMGYLQDWQLHLIGSLDPNMQNYLDQLIAMARAYPIYFHVNADDNDVLMLLGCSPIYWHMTGVSMPQIPGAQEHLGLTPIEAMASGAVPICFASGGPLETIQHSRTGFLVNGVQELLQTTLTMLQNWNVWSSLSEQARRQGMIWQDFPAFVDRVQAMLSSDAVAEMPAVPSLVTRYTESDVTIIIPVHNNWEITRRFLHSLATTARAGAIIIVDNNSTDETQEQASQIQGMTYLRLDENKGYSGAIFEALDLVKTPLVLLANNDLEAIDTNWLAYLAGFMAPDVGIVGPKLLYSDNRLQFAGGVFDWNRPDIGHHRWYGQHDGPRACSIERVPFITGACMLLRKELLEDTPPELLQGLNYEDAHWCLTAWSQGLDVKYVPCVRLYHHEAQTKKAIETVSEGIRDNRKVFQALWGERWGSDPTLAQLRSLNNQLLSQEYGTGD